MVRRLQIKKRIGSPAFAPFQRLPTELRDRILLFALPGPRIVEIFFKISHQASGTTAEHNIIVTSPTKRPELLFVNRESKNETRRQYSALNLGPGFHIPINIYIDFSVDTVYLSRTDVQQRSSPPPSSPSSEIPPTTTNPQPDVPTLNPTGIRPHAAITLSQSPQLHLLKSLAIDSSMWADISLSFLQACPNLESVIVTFQKGSLHDIKPASAAETVTFMHDSQYFSRENRYTQGIFAADGRIRVTAFAAWDAARNGVRSSFKPQEEEANGVVVTNNNTNSSTVDVDGEEQEVVGWLKGEQEVQERWLGVNTWGLGTVYEVEVEKRVIDLRFMTALYPRDKIYDSLGPYDH